MRKRTQNQPDATEVEDRQFVTALQRGLDLLRAFTPDDKAGLGNRELAARTGLPNSTVSRLTYTLLKLGYLTYDDATGRYRMGVPVLGLGYACLGGMSLREAAQPIMQQLADECGDGVLVALGTRDDLTMAYVATARAARGMISLQLNVGSRISLGRSAMGRAYLAATSEHERTELLERLKDRAGPEIWPKLRDGIEDAQDQLATQGFYCNLGQWQPDINSMAVPIASSNDDSPLMVLNIGGPAYILPPERLRNELGPRLMDLARSVQHVQH